MIIELTPSQIKRLSEVLADLSVASFVAGFIAPGVSVNKSLTESIILLTKYIILGILFLWFSLKLVKDSDL